MSVFPVFKGYLNETVEKTRHLWECLYLRELDLTKMPESTHINVIYSIYAIFKSENFILNQFKVGSNYDLYLILQMKSYSPSSALLKFSPVSAP